VGQTNQASDWSQDWTYPFTAAIGDKSAAMRPFAKLHWTLVVTGNSCMAGCLY